MRGASWGRHLGSAVVLLFTLGTGSVALAADPAPAPSASAAHAAPHATGHAAAPRPLLGHARRPIFLGLLAAAFLLIGALAGANDRPNGDPPKT